MKVPIAWQTEIDANGPNAAKYRAAIAEAQIALRREFGRNDEPLLQEKVGTALKSRIEGLLKIKAGQGCGCTTLAAQMDAWGIAGCESQRSFIVDRLLSNRGMLADAVAGAGSAHSVIGWALNTRMADPVLRAGAEWLLNAAFEDVRNQSKTGFQNSRILHREFNKSPRFRANGERVGTALRTRIEGLQRNNSNQCGCTELASKMDDWGIQGCELQRTYIIGELLKSFETTEQSLVTAVLNPAEKTIFPEFAEAGHRIFAASEDGKTASEEAKNVIANWLLDKAIQDTKERPRDSRPPQRFMYVPNPAWTSETRHLTYHVWATKKHDGWKWNLEQLSRRWDLFNGTKILGIALSRDAYSDDDVAGFAQSLGMKFDHVVAVANNSTLREVVTWIPMLRLLDPARAPHSEVVFSAHAKGVRHNDLSKTLETWTRIMYEACLDNWPKVESQLQQFLATGCFKRYNNFTTPGNDCWHYSGTFFWWRLRELGQRNWDVVDQRFFGTESWLGLHAKNEESGCLFLDEVGDLYNAGYVRDTVIPMWERSQ